jgi:hypothetical protein
MSNEAYIAMLKFRYLIPILEKREVGLCQNCGKEEDVYGCHVTKYGGKQNAIHTCHQTLVVALIALFNAANFQAQKDANDRCLSNSHGGNLRPADILADGQDSNGSQDCMDATVVSNMCKNTPRPFLPGKAALDDKLKTCNKHLSAFELSGYDFKAFATDICGILSPSSNILLKRIASAYAVISNRPYSYSRL